MSLRDVLSALGENGLKRTSDGWLARCPAHEDQKASLTIGLKDGGKVVVHCHTGCEAADIVRALGLTMADLFEKDEREERSGRHGGKIVAEYNYRDEQGSLLYQVVRFEPKDFRQRRPTQNAGWEWKLGDVRRVPYRLPELLAAPDQAIAFVVEGEKDADALAKLGLVATTNVGGAGKWRDEYSPHLRGRDVVVLPDNDKPGFDHATQVARSLEGIAASVRTIRLPGLPEKGDVSDWLKAGGTEPKLLALVTGTQPRARFIASPERMAGERSERIDIGMRALSFGVRFLDEALGGITPTDLVLVGAKTGVGKTALATITALHNCRAGKRVHYFALEAEDREIERRMKFQIIADTYFRDRYHPHPIRYLDWYMGRLDRELGPLEDAADRELATITRNLRTFYRYDDFTTDDFVKQLETIKDETDLVVLDHLHYVDSDDENENRGYKKTVKRIRDSAILAGKPVIVVAHVRKGDRRYEPLIPSVEDFHGSSDIPKMATKAIMMAPAFQEQIAKGVARPNESKVMWRTWFQISKCRLDSSLTRFAALLMFDATRNQYADHYQIGRLVEGGKVFAELSYEEKPAWAKPRRQPELDEPDRRVNDD